MPVIKSSYNVLFLHVIFKSTHYITPSPLSLLPTFGALHTRSDTQQYLGKGDSHRFVCFRSELAQTAN